MQKKQENKILLTGHKGFLGEYVHKSLTDCGYNVVGFDLPEHDLVEDDFDCLNDVDGVIHLAALKGIPACDKNPELAVKVNILGTSRLLEACHKKGIKRFLYISTWAVNSHNKKMYDITKKAAEEIVIHYVKRKRMNASILRLATLYGGGMAKEGCLNVFVDRAKKGLPAPVQGDGWEVRQFLEVKDCVNGIITAFEHCPASEEPYVVTSKEVININDVALKICGEIERVPSVDEAENFDVLDASRLESYGWKQKILLDDGIKEMMKK